MKVFFGTIFTLIFIGLACFAGYFAYDLYFNDHTQSDSQSSKDVQQSQEESYQNNDANTQTQQIDEQAAPVTEESSENNDSIKQTSPNKPTAEQSVYLTDAEKNELQQLQLKKTDAMEGKTTMSPDESERLRNLTARFEAMKRLDKYQ